MRVLMIQPNCHCGGAEIAGYWYMRKSSLVYPWTRDRFERRYMMACGAPRNLELREPGAAVRAD